MEAFGGTILIVTHDRYLVERMADRVGLLEKDGFVEPEEGENTGGGSNTNGSNGTNTGGTNTGSGSNDNGDDGDGD